MGTREDGATHQEQVLTKYVEPCRWADSPVDQVLRHTGVVAHIVRSHLVEDKEIEVVAMLSIATKNICHGRPFQKLILQTKSVWVHLSGQGGDLHNDEVAVRGLQEVGVPLHQDLHLVLHPVDLEKFQLVVNGSAYHQSATYELRQHIVSYQQNMNIINSVSSNHQQDMNSIIRFQHISNI